MVGTFIILAGLLGVTAHATPCPDFSGSYTGTRTVTYTNINVSPPVDETGPAGPSPDYKIIQNGCQQIEIDVIGDGKLFGSGQAVYSIGGLESNIGSTVESGFSLTSGVFAGDRLVLAVASRNPDGESVGTTTFIFTTLSRDARGKLWIETRFNTHSPAGQPNVDYIEDFHAN